MSKHNPKTLIIHPQDPSTTFLTDIYSNIRNKTVITGGVTRWNINELIENHDHVYIMGHGTSNGLLSMGVFQERRRNYIVDIAMCENLRDKEKCIYIWCHANKFLEDNKLDGFATGSFISNLDWAYYYRMCVTQRMIDISNLAFSNLLAEYIDEPIELMYYLLKRDYGKLASENPVVWFNNERLFLYQQQNELLNNGMVHESRL